MIRGYLANPWARAAILCTIVVAWIIYLLPTHVVSALALKATYYAGGALAVLGVSALVGFAFYSMRAWGVTAALLVVLVVLGQIYAPDIIPSPPVAVTEATTPAPTSELERVKKMFTN